MKKKIFFKKKIKKILGVFYVLDGDLGLRQREGGEICKNFFFPSPSPLVGIGLNQGEEREVRLAFPPNFWVA
ncbi:hypothetical protein D7V82_22850 [bacterium 1xD8-6]|nr:hypothetical protein D7V82_22850 [bacterium 1xD8-6]